MASGVNLEEKSGVGVPKAVCRCTQPHSGNSCNVAGAKLSWPWCSFGSITDVERGEGHAAWATACSPHNTVQAYIHSITYTYFHTWRGQSNFTIHVDTTRGATNTGYKPSLDWRRTRPQGLLPTLGEILGSHWTAVARLKLGSPQPVRCCPATVCHPHWVHGDKGKPE